MDLDYGTSHVEKKEILCKPLYCTWELNTYSTEQTTDLLRVSVVVNELYLGLIHVSCGTSHFSYCTVKSNATTVTSTNSMYYCTYVGTHVVLTATTAMTTTTRTHFKSFQCTLSNLRTVKSTNECIVVSKKYLYCIYVIIYCTNSISKIHIWRRDL